MTMNYPESNTETGTSLPRFMALVALLALASALMACSTTEGFGEDVKNLGSNVEDSAAKNK